MTFNCLCTCALRRVDGLLYYTGLPTGTLRRVLDLSETFYPHPLPSQTLSTTLTYTTYSSFQLHVCHTLQRPFRSFGMISCLIYLFHILPATPIPVISPMMGGRIPNSSDRRANASCMAVTLFSIRNRTGPSCEWNNGKH